MTPPLWSLGEFGCVLFVAVTSESFPTRATSKKFTGIGNVALETLSGPHPQVLALNAPR